MLNPANTLVYPARMALAHAPTPLQPLSRIARHVGFDGGLWIKRDDLTGSHLSGNKIRKLEFLVAEAKSQNADVLITCGGVQSNHCRATALLAAQLGMRCHLLLRGEEPAEKDGNVLLDCLSGASISYYPSAGFQRNLDSYFKHWQAYYAEQGLRAYGIPTGGSNGTGLWGYIAGTEELHGQCVSQGLVPSHIVTATGSGGTQAGLTLGSALTGLGCKVLGMAVCDDAAWFNRKVAEDMAEWFQQFTPLAERNLEVAGVSLSDLQAITLDNYVGPAYAVADPDVFETIQLAASLEGLVLDPVYTGKAFHGLLQELRAGSLRHARDVVFVHTGGIFGVFPQRAQFAFNNNNGETKK
ncbi:D-cysteine desulfhydrase family protein [Simiduia agarivorans]|uniref:D-cysteine desulfhydrase n=1 Tax=Simiduia agarivorans (strain DSM 21679 / JCM 13881 / BCRC 17597 / SA1) TaxID=1117647 RepID=K4KI87_SIMAS|nr:D-cysteine desulfhydrase family protein [Simiduia agarivorans]AFU97925.1 D-cysteine desulfhydrase [Simiduia agarivorans SA1 = DSM 21679]